MKNLSLSIMTYNICDGGREQRDLLVEVIASADPDLVLLNEADDQATVEHLGRALDMKHIRARGSGTKYIALLSRLPILDWTIYNRRPITQALLQARVETPGGVPLSLYGVHLLPYFMFLPYELARWRTVTAILNLVRRQMSGPHLILGDFNAVAPGDPADLSLFRAHIHRLMWLQAGRIPRLALAPLVRAGYKDCYRSLHPREPGWTWMPERGSARLDYVYADPSMSARLRSCERVTQPATYRASDHFPLLAQFEI